MIGYIKVLADYRERYRSFKGLFFAARGMTRNSFDSDSWKSRRMVMHSVAPCYGYVKNESNYYCYFAKRDNQFDFVYIGRSHHLSPAMLEAARIVAETSLCR